MSIDPRFDSGFARTRNAQNEVLNRGKRNHMGTLDFAAYANANSKRFLGFQGSLFLGRSYGNDSSNVTSCMDIPGYWKINYYKGEALEHEFKQFDKNNDAKRIDKTQVGKSNSMAELGGGSFEIANNMREKILRADKPPSVPPKTRLTFHTVLGHKYYANGGAQGYDKEAKPYVYDKKAHTSSKHELDFILGGYQRNDRQLLVNREEAIMRRNSITENFGHYLGKSSSTPAIAPPKPKRGSSEELDSE